MRECVAVFLICVSLLSKIRMVRGGSSEERGSTRRKKEWLSRG